MCHYKKGNLLPLTTGGRVPHSSHWGVIHTVFNFTEFWPPLLPSVFTNQRQPTCQQRRNTGQGLKKELTELSPTPKNNPVWKPSIYLILGRHKGKNKYQYWLEEMLFNNGVIIQAISSNLFRLSITGIYDCYYYWIKPLFFLCVKLKQYTEKTIKSIAQLV